ncbi:MAG: FAD-binding oxidoreductase [Candidatus Omnitrophota bacterium]|jgi:ferredoxin-NADP reductase
MPDELELKVSEVIKRAPNVKSFRLKTEKEIDYRSGQFLCVSLKTEKECRRYLSISSSPTEKGYIEFTKRITQSDFSKALDNLKEKDPLIVKYPMGSFTLQEGYSKVAFLAGGIGITPVRSICKYATDKKLDTDIVLVYANRSIKDIIFREDLDSMQKENRRLKVAHVLCEPALGFKCTIGLINSQVIKNEVPGYSLRKFFLCGPPSMVEAMQKILLEELSLSEDNIITERFQGY